MDESATPAAPAAPSVPIDGRASDRRLLMRNTLFLSLAQIVGMPLSILLSVFTGRYLGVTALGYLYLATTFNAFAFIAVEWGQFGALPLLVAPDHSRAGRLLGTALVWRGALSLFATGALLVGSYLLGYNVRVLQAIALASAVFSISAISNACIFTVFGFERTDIAARRQVFEQFTTVLVVAPVLVLWGNLNAMLTATALVACVVLVFVSRAIRPVGIGRLTYDFGTLRLLLKQGTPFVFVNLAMQLQPYIDALFLSKLGSADSVGWLAASKRLIGVLIFPAAALGGAFFPTLCRLHATNKEAFIATSSSSLRMVSLLVFPVAIGCLLFPDIGIAVFSRRSFGPAEDDLRVLSAFLFLVYFSMAIGQCVLAAGRQRPWAIVQSLCVGVSLALDPVLVTWFQRHRSNGGLGVCWTSVLSEGLVVGCGIVMSPRGLFDGRVLRAFARAAVAGAAMAAVARALRHLSSFAVAPLAVAIYVVILWLIGGIEKSDLDALRPLGGRFLAKLGVRSK
jgi:O-antigen/teichoic acid export membrane protein